MALGGIRVPAGLAVSMVRLVPVRWKGRLIHLHARLTRGMTVGVRAIVRDGAGGVLLLRHSYMDGWHLPGGGVEHGETVEDAMRRELEEEAGLAMESRPRLASVHANGSNHIVLFEIDDWRTVRTQLSPEIAEVRWFRLDDLPLDPDHPIRQRIEERLGCRPVNPRWNR